MYRSATLKAISVMVLATSLVAATSASAQESESRSEKSVPASAAYGEPLPVGSASPYTDVASIVTATFTGPGVTANPFTVTFPALGNGGCVPLTFTWQFIDPAWAGASIHPYPLSPTGDTEEEVGLKFGYSTYLGAELRGPAGSITREVCGYSATYPLELLIVQNPERQSTAFVFGHGTMTWSNNPAACAPTLAQAQQGRSVWAPAPRIYAGAAIRATYMPVVEPRVSRVRTSEADCSGSDITWFEVASAGAGRGYLVLQAQYGFSKRGGSCGGFDAGCQLAFNGKTYDLSRSNTGLLCSRVPYAPAAFKNDLCLPAPQKAGRFPASVIQGYKPYVVQGRGLQWVCRNSGSVTACRWEFDGNRAVPGDTLIRTFTLQMAPKGGSVVGRSYL